MLTDLGYQYDIDKTLQNIYSINDPITHSTYNTEFNLVFSNYDQGLVQSSLCGKVGEYDIIKDGRYTFLGIDTYLQGQLSNRICFANTRNNLTILNLTAQLLGGSWYFSDHLYNFVEDLTEIRSLQ